MNYDHRKDTNQDAPKQTFVCVVQTSHRNEREFLVVVDETEIYPLQNASLPIKNYM